MKERVRTKPNLADNSPAHKKALKDGVAHYSSWQFNVLDKFKELPPEEIKLELQRTAFPYAVMFEHLIGDFNLGTGIRNANAFNAREVYYLGDKRWDKRAAMGVYNYTEVKFISTLDELATLQDKYTFIGIDNVPGSEPLSNHTWEANTMLVFGEEGVGLTPAMQAFCKKIVYIPQYGSVRSLNCGTASGIVMHDFVSRFKP